MLCNTLLILLALCVMPLEPRSALPGLGLTPSSTPSISGGLCANSIEDQALLGSCIEASSVPELGKLSPLGLALNVTSQGKVGIGTTTPIVKLEVVGDSSGVAIRGTHSSSLGTGVRGHATYTGTAGVSSGVEGYSESPVGVGVLGRNFAVTGLNYGVQGFTSSPTGVGAYGKCFATSGVCYGVQGLAASTSGIGVLGQVTQSLGSTTGVRGLVNSSSTTSKGVSGESTSGGIGVFGKSSTGKGIHGESNTKLGVYGKSNQQAGVYGESSAPNINTTWSAVFGISTTTTGDGAGVEGLSMSPEGFGVWCTGAFKATGLKQFVQPHPTDPSKEIRFVCLEGNEAGTYFRGSARLIGGQATIEVPEEFRLVSESSALTVQLTPVGELALLCVLSKDLDRIVVKGDRDVEFDYLVNGVRRGFAEHEPIRRNRTYVPKVRDVPYATQYPEAFRRILVENGILNADFTPSELTAAQMGWELVDSGPSDE